MIKNVPDVRFAGFDDVWEEKKLGDVSDIVGGGTPDTSNSKYWGGDVDWYSPSELSNQIYVKNSQIKITDLGLKKSSAKLLPEGTILFTSRAGIGKTAILENASTTNQGFQSIVPKEGLLDTYFTYCKSQDLKRFGEKMGSGSTFLEVSGKQMSKMSVLLPNLNEQQKIGAFFQKIDAAIALCEREVDLLKAQKKGFLQQLFPASGARVPAVRFAGFDGEWEEKKLGEMVDFYSGLTYSPSNIVNQLGTLVLRSSNVKDNNIVFYNDVRVDSTCVNSTNVMFDDIVVVVRNGSRSLIGKHAKIKNFMPDTVIGAFMTGLRSQNADFVNSILDTQLFQKEINKNLGATINQITTGIFKKMIFMFPSTAEQTKIGTFFKTLDDRITQQQQKLDHLKQQKKGLLQKMFV